MLVVEVRDEEGRRRGRRRGRRPKEARKEAEGRKEARSAATNIKSNNPHLAGGEKMFQSTNPFSNAVTASKISPSSALNKAGR